MNLHKIVSIVCYVLKYIYNAARIFAAILEGFLIFLEDLFSMEIFNSISIYTFNKADILRKYEL